MLKRWLVVAAAVALAGCSSEEKGPAAKDGSGGKKYKIAFLLTLDNPYWNNFPDGAREAAAKGWAEVTFYNAKEDVNAQIQQIQQAIATQVDAVCIVPMKFEALVEGIQALNRAKIPVIVVNRRVAEGCDYVCYTGTDTYKGAVNSAKILMKAIGGKGEIVELHQHLGTDPQLQRSKALDDVVKEYPEVKIVARVPHEGKQEKAITETQVLLARYPNLKGIYAHGDDFAIAAAEACIQKGRKDVAIVGMGGSKEAIEAIRSGKITGTSYQQPREEGRMGVELAIRCLKGEKLVKEYPIDAPGITKENADKFEGQF